MAETKTSVNSQAVIYGRLSKVKMTKLPWGRLGVIYSNFGRFSVNGFLVDFRKEANYSEWAKTGCENLCWVESGRGKLHYQGKEYVLQEGVAFKVHPGNSPIIVPEGRLVLWSNQMKVRKQASQPGVEVVNCRDLPDKVYEYEALAKEVFVPKEKNRLGLLRFVFPIDKIPLHIHPFSDRIIRVISGKGYTYAAPNLHEMSGDSYCIFPKGTIHTNGPVPGFVYTLYALQMPWVDSKIDEVEIAGDKRFVKYVGATLPKELWKNKGDFYRAIRRLTRKKAVG